MKHMNYVDALEAWMDNGTNDLWRNVKAMPEDKLTWKAAETSRTARELIEELVYVMPYNITVAKTLQEPKGEMDTSLGDKSLAELEKQHRAYIKEFIAAVREFPEEKLHEKMTLPWGEMFYLDILSYPYWNLMYHIGQIAYIQTLYGDKEMH